MLASLALTDCEQGDSAAALRAAGASREVQGELRGGMGHRAQRGASSRRFRADMGVPRHLDLLCRVLSLSYSSALTRLHWRVCLHLAWRAKKWHADFSKYNTSPAMFIESIPFKETREYVQTVIISSAIYKELFADIILEREIKKENISSNVYEILSTI